MEFLKTKNIVKDIEDVYEEAFRIQRLYRLSKKLYSVDATAVEIMEGMFPWEELFLLNPVLWLQLLQEVLYIRVTHFTCSYIMGKIVSYMHIYTYIYT